MKTFREPDVCSSSIQNAHEELDVFIFIHAFNTGDNLCMNVYFSKKTYFKRVDLLNNKFIIQDYF